MMKKHSEPLSNNIITDAVQLYETVTGRSAENVNLSYIMGFVDCYYNYRGDNNAND